MKLRSIILKLEGKFSTNFLSSRYVSCVMGCPYEGDVDPEKVNWVAEKLYNMGRYFCAE